MEKWARAKYLPNLPLKKDADGHFVRVTASDEHIRISREAAKEGMVLLKNDRQLLPLAKGARIALFGKASFDYVKGGGGSGDVHTPWVHNLYDGFMSLSDEVSVFPDSAQFYQDYVQKAYAEGGVPGLIAEPALPDDLVQKAAHCADTAVISISRFSGEAWDRSSTCGSPAFVDSWVADNVAKANEIFPGSDYYLSPAEKAMVDKVKDAFSRVVVVLNVGGVMDAEWFRTDDGIGAVLAAWQGGMDGGMAAAELIMGHGSPSGRLADTFAKHLEDYPSTGSFHQSDDYVEYTEDIYVGYRYFQTVPGAADLVSYPFGYGLSYTQFETRFQGVTKETVPITPGSHDSAQLQERGTTDVLTFRALVTNVGGLAGKEVVQLYAGAPQGLLGKPARVLIAYHKTRLLAPGESELVTLRIDVRDLASYDDLGRICKSSYVLEQGDYHFYLGANVRDAKDVGDVWHLDGDLVTERLSSKLAPSQLSFRLRSDGTFENLPLAAPNDPDENALEPLPKNCREGVTPSVRGRDHIFPLAPEGSPYAAKKRPQLIDVVNGKITLDDFVASLSDEDLAYLLSGTPNTGVANTFGFGNIPEAGVPNIMTADGPAGVRFNPETGVQTTAFPCATLLACTWNPDIVYAVGRAGAEEAKENNIGIWLTPAVNIHRSPLCGRNFEYYSEDPFLAGHQAAAMVKGIQSCHIAATVKHFALNDKETNRKNSDSRCSERAIREIYLKQFEIIVKEADPWCIMTSYNIINGHRASESKGLLTGILREEWGWKGCVTTDWWTNGEHYKECAAGNDVKMGCGYPDRLLKAMEKGILSRELMEKAAKNVLGLIMKMD